MTHSHVPGKKVVRFPNWLESHFQLQVGRGTWLSQELLAKLKRPLTTLSWKRLLPAHWLRGKDIRLALCVPPSQYKHQWPGCFLKPHLTMHEAQLTTYGMCLVNTSSLSCRFHLWAHSLLHPSRYSGSTTHLLSSQAGTLSTQDLQHGTETFVSLVSEAETAKANWSSAHPLSSVMINILQIYQWHLRPWRHSAVLPCNELVLTDLYFKFLTTPNSGKKSNWM